MKYPIAIEVGDAGHAFGVVVPDLPGCFSAGDTMEEAIDNATEAIELWLEAVIDDGGSVPEPKPIAAHQHDPELAGWVWGVGLQGGNIIGVLLIFFGEKFQNLVDVGKFFFKFLFQFFDFFG